jgi:hypothetical protein
VAIIDLNMPAVSDDLDGTAGDDVRRGRAGAGNASRERADIISSTK